MGEIVLETLLSSNIDSITDLNLSDNYSWFYHPETHEERTINIELLAELISKQAGLHHINLGRNCFSITATLTILTRIADHPGTNSKLYTLGLIDTNFEADETVEKLADIL